LDFTNKKIVPSPRLLSWITLDNIELLDTLVAVALSALLYSGCVIQSQEFVLGKASYQRRIELEADNPQIKS